jgi:hypothetical protein
MKNLNPEWNQKFEFQVKHPKSDILRLRVYDYDSFTSDDDFLGFVEIKLSELKDNTETTNNYDLINPKDIFQKIKSKIDKNEDLSKLYYREPELYYELVDILELEKNKNKTLDEVLEENMNSVQKLGYLNLTLKPINFEEQQKNFEKKKRMVCINFEKLKEFKFEKISNIFINNKK